jgi:hypothetical protein
MIIVKLFVLLFVSFYPSSALDSTPSWPLSLRANFSAFFSAIFQGTSGERELLVEPAAVDWAAGRELMSALSEAAAEETDGRADEGLAVRVLRAPVPAEMMDPSTEVVSEMIWAEAEEVGVAGAVVCLVGEDGGDDPTYGGEASLIGPEYSSSGFPFLRGQTRSNNFSVLGE